jgi:hypothetical protein
MRGTGRQLTRLLTVVLLTSLLTLSTPGNAQQSDATPEPSCPQLVRQALELTRQNCEVIGRNQVCYGHLVLSASAQPGREDFKFEAPGDIEDIIAMRSLSLSALDVLQQVWGVILMQVQAGLELDAQQNVTMVVFGDTQIETATLLLEGRTRENVTARAAPDAAASPVAVLAAETQVTVNGRSADNAWIRVQVNPATLESAWIRADLIEIAGDRDALPVVDPQAISTTINFGPMQAFYFQSGRDDAPCEEAPNSGLLIQTPEGAAEVTLWIDEVIIQLDTNASAFVQADANGSLDVNLLEGTARVVAAGETRRALPGTRVSVSLDEALRAISPPSELQAFDAQTVAALPVELLERPITIPEPLAVVPGVPAAGSWQFAWGVDSLTCPDGTIVPFRSSGVPGQLLVSADGSILNWGGDFGRIAEGVYTRSYIDAEGNLYQDTLNIAAVDAISGTSQIEFSERVCSLTVPFALTFVR